MRLLELALTRKISWRRLAVFAVATALLVSGHVTQEIWVAVAVAFIGGEAAQRVVAASWGEA